MPEIVYETVLDNATALPAGGRVQSNVVDVNGARAVNVSLAGVRRLHLARVRYTCITASPRIQTESKSWRSGTRAEEVLRSCEEPRAATRDG